MAKAAATARPGKKPPAGLAAFHAAALAKALGIGQASVYRVLEAARR
jgi:hypothetical protein